MIAPAINEQCVAANLIWAGQLSIDSIDIEARAAIDSLRLRFADGGALRPALR